MNKHILLGLLLISCVIHAMENNLDVKAGVYKREDFTFIVYGVKGWSKKEALYNKETKAYATLQGSDNKWNYADDKAASVFATLSKAYASQYREKDAAKD